MEATEQKPDFDVLYRPHVLDDVVGQPDAVKVIRSWKSVPRCVLLHGGSGQGKTTLARIVTEEILGVPLDGLDYKEINCGQVESALDMVREIGFQMTGLPLMGSKRVFVLDEVQILSGNNRAQQALLKVLEDCPTHVQFFLATTDPKKLLPAIRGRCVDVALKPIKEKELAALVGRIAEAEKLEMDNEVVDRIVALADGAARNAVKALQKIADLKTDDERLESLGRGLGEDSDAFALAKALMYSGKPTWSKVAEVLTKLDAHDPEGLRCMLLAAARTSLLKNGAATENAYTVIEYLSDPCDDRRSGAALLAARCYAICKKVK